MLSMIDDNGSIKHAFWKSNKENDLCVWYKILRGKSLYYV